MAQKTKLRAAAKATKKTTGSAAAKSPTKHGAVAKPRKGGSPAGRSGAAKPAAAANRSATGAAKTTARPTALKKAPVKSAQKPTVDHSRPRHAAKPAASTQRGAPLPSARPAAPVQQRAVPAAVSKSAQPRITAPVTPKDIAARTVEARQSAQAAKKPVSQRHGFKTNEFIVYPAHGVGRIVGIEEQEIAGMSLELFVITFEKDKMTLRVPTGKLQSVGMRKLADDDIVKKALDTLKGRARVKRTMWSRRAQEYEAKINSGDLVSIAEVVRDLYRSELQPEQSYSERQLYEAALDRMAREIAAIEKLDDRGAVQRITDVLSKSARGRRALTEGGDPFETEVKAA